MTTASAADGPLPNNEIEVIKDDHAAPRLQDRMVNERWPCIHRMQSWIERGMMRILSHRVFD